MRKHHPIGRRLVTALAALAFAAAGGCRSERTDSPARDAAGGTSAAQSDWVTPRADSSVGSGFPADTPTAAAASSRAARRPPTPARVAPPPRDRGPRAGTTASRAGEAGTRAAASTTPSPAASATADTAPLRDAAGATTTATTTATPAAAPAAAPAAPAAPGTPTTPPPIPTRAFAAGERLTYDVRFGPIRVGKASMEVLGLEQLRGRDVYHTRFIVRGGTPFYRVNDRYESWFDARTMESLRYAQQIDQGSYERERLFDMYPERRTFTQGGSAEHQPSVADPLDDGSFLYFLRTIPLEVGKTYEFNRYFRPDRNPVRGSVLRHERVRVPAGTFDAIVVRPTIKTRGIFSEGGRAEVWFAADSTRRMLQMKSRLSFGTLNLYLRRVEP
jgi:hypothetical protein